MSRLKTNDEKMIQIKLDTRHLLKSNVGNIIKVIKLKNVVLSSTKSG
jgi:hypothetical protein